MTDNNLIFLISQPRSGSTLTQKILGTHSEIYTRSEPWVMLNPLYSLKNKGVSAEYDTQLEQHARNEFIADLPNGGENKYIQYLRDMYLSMYNDYLNANNKKIFLDKTPRYHLITKELNLVFPNAKQIILIRNPLAVLSSLIPRKKSLYDLAKNKLDLTTAIDTFIQIMENPNENQYILQYEDILNDPQKTITNLCNYLEINFEEEMIESFLQGTDTWTFGDQKIYDKSGIDKNNVNKWQDVLHDAQHWRLIYDYLNLVGPEKMKKLGYDYNELLLTLEQQAPSKDIDMVLNTTTGLNSFLTKNTHEEKPNLHYENKLRDQEKKLTVLQDQLFKIKRVIQELINIKTLFSPVQKYQAYKKLLLNHHTLTKHTQSHPKTFLLPSDMPHIKPHQRFCIDENEHPVLIYQVGKVGSSAIYKGLKEQIQSLPVYQVHNINKAQELLDKTIKDNIKGNVAHFIRGIGLKKTIIEEPDIQWKIIIGVREPISRWVSDIFENIHTRYKFLTNSDNSVNIEKTIQFIKDTIDNEPQMKWFDDEFFATFKLNLLDKPFNGHYQTYQSKKIDILIYKFENMQESIPTVIKDFLDIKDFNLQTTNAATQKSTADAYKEVKEQLKFDTSFLDSFYKKNVISHFYTEEEIEGFKTQWQV